MKSAMFLAAAFALTVLPQTAGAQQSGHQPAPTNRTATDDCEAEANRLYRIPNLEQRMAMKREHIAKCRAAQRGQTRR